MNDYHINIFYSEQGGGYVADIPDLEACSAFGDTPEAALAEVDSGEVRLAKGGTRRWQANTRAALPASHLSGGVETLFARR